MACTEARCIDCGWEDYNCSRPYICPKCRGKNLDWYFDEEYDHSPTSGCDTLDE